MGLLYDPFKDQLMSSTRKVPNYYYIVAFLDSSKIYPTSFFSVFFLHFFSSIFFPTVFPVGENKGKKTAAGRKNSQQKKQKKPRCGNIFYLFLFFKKLGRRHSDATRQKMREAWKDSAGREAALAFKKVPF